MMDAFSYAKEYCEVGLWVKASNLESLDQNIGNSQMSMNIPGERYLDVVLIHRESEVQELKLAVISVEKVPPSGAVLPSASHILSKSVQGRALLRVPFRIIAICLSDIGFEGLYPVYFICCL